MTWGKDDENVDQHRKFLALAPEHYMMGLGLHRAMRAYACRTLSDGFVPANFVRQLLSGETPKRAQLLIDDMLRQSLLDRSDGGYLVHGFLEYNPSRQEVAARREATRQRVGKHRTKTVTPQGNDGNPGGGTPPVAPPSTDGNGGCNAVTEASVPQRYADRTHPPVPSPVPYPVPEREADARAPAGASPTGTGPPSAPGVLPAEPMSPDSALLLAELQRHPCLESVASPALADALSARIMTSGARAEWLATAIGECAEIVAARTAAGEAFTTAMLSEMLARFTRRARAPAAARGLNGTQKPAYTQPPSAAQASWFAPKE